MEWVNDHKYNNNLVRVQFESRKALHIFFTDISYLKGIDKILEQRRVFQFRTHRKKRQGNPGGGRDGKVSGRLQVSRLSSKTFKICRLSSILHCSELKIY